MSLRNSTYNTNKQTSTASEVSTPSLHPGDKPRAGGLRLPLDGTYVELHKYFKFSPKSGPATAITITTAQIWTCPAQYQAQRQHSSLVPASGLAAYPFSIRPVMLSPERAQQHHVRSSKKKDGLDFAQALGAGPVGSN